MARIYDALDDALITWIKRQPVVFVATAPLAADGHVNVSPKGTRGTFRILGPTTVAYLDLVGSGIETVAHLRENGRVVCMFCAFDGPPKILRLHGRGSAITPDDPAFAGLLDGFEPDGSVRDLVRSVVVVEIDRVADACGFGVPMMDFVGHRDQASRWAEQQAAKNGPGWKAAYIAGKNTVSIDGILGVDPRAYEPAPATADPTSR
ncbi:MAG TPA: pyridoxamine 5'-phosphate oxidase family protein [Thermomicrobiales bacterium]|nr:pyridoxamine 5'-phosphate oxidase family protein [Thermomicrobiales bacterium]